MDTGNPQDSGILTRPALVESANALDRDYPGTSLRWGCPGGRSSHSFNEEMPFGIRNYGNWRAPARRPSPSGPLRACLRSLED